MVDHASTMGATCKELGREFHGCFSHFLNLVCKMFFDSIKKNDCNFDITPEQSEDEDDSVNQTCIKEEICKNLMHDSNLGINVSVLAVIEEEMEEELAYEALSFECSNFTPIALKINLVLLKVKRVVSMFNSSNNLSRVLLKSQKESPLDLISDSLPYKVSIVFSS